MTEPALVLPTPAHPFAPELRLVQAVHYQYLPPAPAPQRVVSLITAHSMEDPDRPDDAEAVAAWMADPVRAPQASAHVYIDQNSAVLGVMPKDIAWACGGGNYCSYNIEQGGFAHWTRDVWLAEPNHSMLVIAAAHAKKAAVYFGIPTQELSEAEVAECLRDGQIRTKKLQGELSGNPGGFTQHVVVNGALRNWKKYGLAQPKGDLGHTDCGPGYPMDVLLDMIRTPSTVPAPPGDAAPPVVT